MWQYLQIIFLFIFFESLNLLGCFFFILALNVSVIMCVLVFSAQVGEKREGGVR